MFQINITDEDGNIVMDEESYALVVVSDQGGAISSTAMVNADIDTLFQMAITMDMVRDKILSQHPILRFLYKFRRKLIKSVAQIDLSLLNEALKRREENDDEQG